MTGEVRYILVSTTRGDELFSPRQSIVLESADREKLERLRDERAREREAWLRKYGSELPDYIEESLIDTEEIQAVTSI